jgi:polyisoprenoid-binding protein YceI
MSTQKNWVIDPAHSVVAFKVKHLMISSVNGSFSMYKASVKTQEFNFATALVNFVLYPKSIDTGSVDRDNHLRSPDFFDVEKFPEITFNSDKVEKVDEDTFVMTGGLTIKGITKKVSLDVEFGGIMTDPWGNRKAGFSVNGKINRKDFGLNWNTALETGGVLVGEEVKINAEVQFVLQA